MASLAKRGVPLCAAPALWPRRAPDQKERGGRVGPPLLALVRGWACKPGSVTPSGASGHLSGTRVAARLERSPGDVGEPGRLSLPIGPCTGWGLPSCPCYQGHWCALTAPFHPCAPPSRASGTRSALCCTCRRLTRPAVSWHPCPSEPGLSSASPKPAATRPPTPQSEILARQRRFQTFTHDPLHVLGHLTTVGGDPRRKRPAPAGTGLVLRSSSRYLEVRLAGLAPTTCGSPSPRCRRR